MHSTVFDKWFLTPFLLRVLYVHTRASLLKPCFETVGLRVLGDMDATNADAAQCDQFSCDDCPRVCENDMGTTMW